MNKIYWCPRGGEWTIHQKTKSRKYKELNEDTQIWYDFYCDEFGWFYHDGHYCKYDSQFKDPCFSAPVPRIDKMSKEDREELKKFS